MKDVLMQIVGSEWFAFLVIGPIVGVVFSWILNKNKKLHDELVKQMLIIQKLYPDWAGEEKKKLVVKILNEKFTWVKAIPDAALYAMVDAIIDELKSEVVDDVGGEPTEVV